MGINETCRTGFDIVDKIFSGGNFQIFPPLPSYTPFNQCYVQLFNSPMLKGLESPCPSRTQRSQIHGEGHLVLLARRLSPKAVSQTSCPASEPPSSCIASLPLPIPSPSACSPCSGP